ncbi:hypothetical protein ABK040_008992 [Willaertia magna]
MSFVCVKTFYTIHIKITSYIDSLKSRLWDLEHRAYINSDAAVLSFNSSLNDLNFVYQYDVNKVGKIAGKVIEQSKSIQKIKDDLNAQLTIKILRLVPPSVVQFTNSNGTFTKCFGRNSAGICGDGVSAEATVSTTAFPLIPVFPPGTTIKTISCGYHHCLALTTDNLLYSWGSNTYASVGHFVTPVKKPMRVDMSAIGDKVIVSISASYYNSYVITSDNTVYSWGSNDQHQLCEPTYIASSSSMRAMPSPIPTYWLPKGRKIIKAFVACKQNKNNPVQIDTKNVDPKDPWVDVEGSFTMFALTRNGNVYSFGMGAKGTVGSGKTVDVERPTIMDYFRDNNIAIKKICSSMRYALAISTKGNVYFWGQMFDYTGVTSYTDMFVRPGSFSVFSGGSALDIICAVEGAIVVMENGTVYGFGANNYGMLADGTSTATKTPVKATFFTKQ